MDNKKKPSLDELIAAEQAARKKPIQVKFSDYRSPLEKQANENINRIERAKFLEQQNPNGPMKGPYAGMDDQLNAEFDQANKPKPPERHLIEDIADVGDKTVDVVKSLVNKVRK